MDFEGDKEGDEDDNAAGEAGDFARDIWPGGGYFRIVVLAGIGSHWHAWSG